MSLPCPHCRRPLKLGPELAGRKVRCSACQNIFVVPAAASSRSRSTPPAARPLAERLQAVVTNSPVGTAVLNRLTADKEEEISKALSPLGNLWEAGILPEGQALQEDDLVALYTLGRELTADASAAHLGWYLMAFSLQDHSFPHPLHSLLGISDTMGRANTRVGFLRKAVAAKRDYAYALLTLGNELKDYGVTPDNAPLFQEAIQCFNRAAESLPETERYRERAIKRWDSLVANVTRLDDGQVHVQLRR